MVIGTGRLGLTSTWMVVNNCETPSPTQKGDLDDVRHRSGCPTVTSDADLVDRYNPEIHIGCNHDQVLLVEVPGVPTDFRNFGWATNVQRFRFLLERGGSDQHRPDQQALITNADETARGMMTDFKDHKVGMKLDGDELTQVVKDGKLFLESGIREDCHVVLKMKTVDLFSAIDNTFELMEIKDKGELIKGDMTDPTVPVPYGNLSLL